MDRLNKIFRDREKRSDLSLENGSRIAVIGGGPAGSMFSYFLLALAGRTDLRLQVDLYEPRNFSVHGPRGCNMCGGVISETLVQNLATEGINLAPDIIQRGIDSYVMHTDVGKVRIETPVNEMRIGAVFRGAGPRDMEKSDWKSFDGYLQKLAVEKGARLLCEKVESLGWEDGRPSLKPQHGQVSTYDLVVVATGVNSTILKIFEGFGIGYQRPIVSKTLIREYHLGAEIVGRTLGNSMHVFLLPIPGLKFAAIIPKGDYITVAMLGDNLDDSVADAFMSTPQVRECIPPGWHDIRSSCQCLPFMNVRGVKKSFADRLLFIGDAGVTRLYKDGIGAAYRTAKTAARVAVFKGISEKSFRRYYQPVCRRISRDNRLGRIAFGFTGIVKRIRFLRQAVLVLTAEEQLLPGQERRLSSALWDMFSGSESYKNIMGRLINVGFLIRFLLIIFTLKSKQCRNMRPEVTQS